MDCLHNYCSVNKTAIDKIVKKHDKCSTNKSRQTIQLMISHLSFYKEEGHGMLKLQIERLWKRVGSDRNEFVQSSLFLLKKNENIVVRNGF